MQWNIYLSGEIHTDWRQQIIEGCQALDLPIEFTSAVTDHAASDAAHEQADDQHRDGPRRSTATEPSHGLLAPAARGATRPRKSP